MCERCIESLSAISIDFFSFWRLCRAFQLDSCAQNVFHFLSLLQKEDSWAHSFCAILFNKFSASKHKMDPIIKQIHNIHSLTIKGNRNHKNWMMLSDQNQPSERCPMAMWTLNTKRKRQNKKLLHEHKIYMTPMRKNYSEKEWWRGKKCHMTITVRTRTQKKIK